MDPEHALVEVQQAISLDALSVLAGVGLALVSLCVTLLLLSRWIWNRLARYELIRLERKDNKVRLAVVLDATPRGSLLSKIRDLGKSL